MTTDSEALRKETERLLDIAACNGMHGAFTVHTLAHIRALQSALDKAEKQLRVVVQQSCLHKWPHSSPTPASWMCHCGTKVYRSYEDYVDD